jgi:hypothetical protein
LGICRVRRGTQEKQASQKSQDALTIFSIRPPPSGDPRWWADLGEGVRRMTIKEVPKGIPAELIFKGR